MALDGCAKRATRPAESPVRIFVTDARLERLPLYAAAVRERQAVSPTIWLMVGDPFADSPLKTLGDGAAEAALLNRAGVDAVVLTPAWLAAGLPRVNEMVAKSRFYSLSACLLDSTGQTIGHPFMVRKSGSTSLAITGLAIDSTSVLLRMAGVQYTDPGFAVAKTLALMRQNSDLVGVMVEPRSTLPIPGADFTLNVAGSGVFAMTPSEDASRLNSYEVSADAGRLIVTSVELGRLKPDSALVQLLDSVRKSTESLATRAFPSRPGSWTSERLSGTLVRGVFAAGLADGFFCDSLLLSEFKVPATVGDLVAVLRDPGRLAVLRVEGRELAGWPSRLALRPGLSRAKLSSGSTYRVATTVDCLQRHPEMVRTGFELSARPFWTICLEILESGQVE